MSDKEATPPQSKIDYRKTDDFWAEYANNILLTSSNWDLKLTFGELDQSISPNTVVQKMAATIPWAQAKVLHYFLGLHLLGHETEHGRIIIPSGIIGEFPKEIPEGISKEAYLKSIELSKKFFADNPEALPKK